MFHERTFVSVFYLFALLNIILIHIITIFHPILRSDLGLKILRTDYNYIIQFLVNGTGIQPHHKFQPRSQHNPFENMRSSTWTNTTSKLCIQIKPKKHLSLLYAPADFEFANIKSYKKIKVLNLTTSHNNENPKFLDSITN